MTVSRVLAFCGLSVGLTGALAAQPQTPPKPDPAKPTQPDRPETGKPDPARPAAVARGDETSMLKQLEGRWKVEVSVNPAMWNPHLFKDEARPADGAKPAAHDQADLSKTVTGYSNVKLILGERVVQETTVLLDMKAKMDRGDKPDDKPRTKTPGDDKFRGVSLLSFDEKDRTYSMVFVDNCQGDMHYCTGSYDAGANRIVFNSVDHGPAVTDRRTSGAPSNPNSSPTSSPNSTPNSSPDHGKWQGLAGMQVVLELVGPDEHRVTMYATGNPYPARPATGAPGDGNNPGGSPTDKPRTDQPTDRASQPMSPADGAIVYRAVYRRASGSDLDKFRDALRLSDAAER